MSSHGAGIRAQSQVVYAAALVQGIVLVTFPAASAIFTSASSYGLSSSQYGAMFLPQAITAVGLVIAFYQVGYGIAAFGVRPLRRAGLTLPGLYGASALVAVALGCSRWPWPTAARHPGPCTPGRCSWRPQRLLRPN